MNYGFKPYWEPKLLDGSKRTTLRKRRKDGRVPVVDEPFVACFGMRTKHFRRLFESTTEKVQSVRIALGKACKGYFRFHRMTLDGPVGIYRITVDGRRLGWPEANEIAVADGFDDLTALLAFFEKEHKIHALPFEGYLIRWAQPVRFL